MTTKQIMKRYSHLVIGLILFAFGSACAVNANIGINPWGVFNQGLTNILPITYGQASICVGIAILFVDVALGQPIGVGTLLDILIIGSVVDLLFALGWIPICQTLFGGLVMMAISILLLSVGSYFYLGSGFGSGPRDALMVALVQKFPTVPVGVIRSGLEGCALIVGWILGGQVGVGTVVSVFGLGFVMQTVFQLLKFDVGAVHHESLKESFTNLKAALEADKQPVE